MNKVIFFVLLPVTFLIKLYRYIISPLFPVSCRFQPTCSDYALDAIRLHKFRGVVLAARRIIRCHPFGGHGYDPVPTTSLKKPRADNK